MTANYLPSITLAELWERTSAAGNRYFAGYLGGLSIALLCDGEREHPTRPGETVVVWRLVAQERPVAARRSPQKRDPAPAGRVAPPEPGSRSGAASGGLRRVPARESAAARRDRAAAETVERLGAGDLNDPIPF